MEGKGIKLSLIIESLIWFAWCAIILVFANYDKAGFYFWAGLICGTIAFGISVVSKLMIKPKNNRTTTEVSFISIFATEAFFVIELVINTIFVLIADAEYKAIVVIVNTVILIVFVATRLYADSYLKNTANVAAQTVAKMQPIANVSRQLGYLLSIANTPETKKKLRLLKENVDYSNNVSAYFTREYEERFLLVLSQVQTSIESNMDEVEIIRRIDEADRTWKGRNSIIATTK